MPAAVDAVASLVRRQRPDWRVNARRLFGARGIVAPAHTDGRRWPDRPLRAALAAAHVDGGGGLAARLRCSTRPWPVATPGTRLASAGPALRELAAFYEDFLTPVDGDGHVIFAPSYSPENEPAGWTPAAVNATMDIAAARHALLAAAAARRDADPGRRAPLAGAGGPAAAVPAHRRRRARRVGVAARRGLGGRRCPPTTTHRHVSHLYPVWPLHEITAADTPALAAAALRALRARGAQDDSAHGYLHKALAAARLRDAGLAGRPARRADRPGLLLPVADEQPLSGAVGL